MPKKLTAVHGKSVTFLQYVADFYYVAEQTIEVNKNRLLTTQDTIEPINFEFYDNKIKMLRFKNKLQAAEHAVKIIRKNMVERYGDGMDITGHCIEASELLVAALKFCGVKNAVSVNGMCRLETEDEWAAHMWVKIPGKSLNLPGIDYYYADVTAEQFNDAMLSEHAYPEIIFQPTQPYNMFE